MLAGRIQIRRYEPQIKTLLDNLANLTEPEKSSELNYWRDKDLQVLVFKPEDEPDRLKYIETRDRATAKPFQFHIYPAFRTQPLTARDFQFSSYVDPDFWSHNADRLRSLAALRLPGDPWIGIDMESYAGEEPTASALADTGHHPLFSVAQLRAAMQPFIDALRETNAFVAAYPAGIAHDGKIQLAGEDMIYVAEAVGRERMEFWTYNTYPNAENYRRSPALQWPIAVAEFLRLMGEIQSRFPGYVFRPGINDVERVWAEPYLRDLLRGGPVAPFGFDHTRYDDKHFNNFGTTEYRNGFKLSTLNRGLRHVWPISPNATKVPEEFDTTWEPIKRIKLVVYAGKSDSEFKEWGETATPHIKGIEFAAPTPYPNCAWAGLVGQSVLPELLSEPFTVDGTLRLSLCLSTSCPLFGAVWNNQESWQVAYDHTTNRIGLYVRNPHAPPGTPRYYHCDIMKAEKGVDLRFQIGRNGSEWLFQGATAWPVGPVGGSFPPINLPLDAGGKCPHLLIGAGQTFADFPKSNSMAYCPGIVIVGTWSIYDRLLSPAELQELRTETWVIDASSKPPKVMSRKGSWPYGYGRMNL